MKKPILAATLALTALGVTIAVPTVPASATDKEATDFLVVLDDGVTAEFEDAIADAGGRIVKYFDQIDVAVVSAPADVDLGGFGAVARDEQVTGGEASDGDAIAIDAIPQPPNTGDDDFFFDLQYGHTYVRAQEAWAEGSRGAGVRVFVLDEGFDLDHPDLAPNYNLALSTTFVPGSTDAQYLLADTFSHGTHVAGTIGAADNAFGTIGVAPEVELVPVKVLDELTGGSGAFSWIIEGILYAADNGADIINMSLGTIIAQGAGPDAAEIAALRVAVNKAITYAYRSGAATIVSAGNDSLDLNDPEAASLINFMGYASDAISISALGTVGWATDPANAVLEQASYTNSGPEIDFSAPGGDLAYPGNENCVVAGLTRPCYVFDLIFSTGNGGWYWSAGTSMAAPHAAGIAAIIIGENGGDMNPAQVKREMRKRAEDLGRRGVDEVHGYGLVTSGY